MLRRDFPGHCPGVCASAPPVEQGSEGLSALYVGAGADTRYLGRVDPRVTRFVCVDSQPFGEFGTAPGFARPGFLPRLYDAMAKADFKCITAVPNVAALTPGLVSFVKDHRRVDYLFSAPMPLYLEILPPAYCQALIVAGHDPPRAVVDYACLPAGLAFFGFQNTCYDFADSPHSVLHALHHDPHFRARFTTFTFFADDDAPPATVATWQQFLHLAHPAT